MCDDKLDQLETLKLESNRKGDINHALKLDIQDKEHETALIQDEVR